MSQGHGEEHAMTLGEVVAFVGAVEIFVLVAVLVAMVIDARPVRLGVDAPARRKEPRKVKEAA
jgi:hypothetical protein